jgi:hypothetical protein
MQIATKKLKEFLYELIAEAIESDDKAFIGKVKDFIDSDDLVVGPQQMELLRQGLLGPRSPVRTPNGETPKQVAFALESSYGSAQPH